MSRSSQEACTNGPNACSSLFGQAQCEYTPGICGTGLATAPDIATAQLHDSYLHSNANHAVLYEWSCPPDLPPGALPSGSGFLCYVSKDMCNDGETAALLPHNFVVVASSSFR